MAATAEDVIATLRSIEEWLETINGNLSDLMTHFGVPDRDAVAAAPNNRPVAAIASDADLDGQHGNPEVKAKSPRDWTGDSQQGKRFSECPPAYLDLVASRLDYFAETNAASADEAERKKARFNRLDAARARGWAARLRAGWTPPAEPSAFGEPATGAALTDDEIPF